MEVHRKQLEKDGPVKAALVVRFCRVDKLRDPNLKRLRLCVKEPDPQIQGASNLERDIIAAMGEIGAERKDGRAPLGYMEETLQKALEKLDR